MKKTMARIISSCLMCFIACQGMMVAASNSPVSLKLWHIWGDSYIFNDALDNFRKAHPDIQFEIDGTSVGYDTKLKTAIAANEAPDIFFSWGGTFSAPFVRAGKVLPLDGYLNDGTRSKLTKGSLSNFSYSGKVYALPTSMAIGVLFCNKELFYKYDVKIPETYQELISAIRVFNNRNVLPVAVGGKDLRPGMGWYDVLALRTAGAQLCRNALTKKVSFNRTELTVAAAKLAELVKWNAFGNRAPEQTPDQAVSLFIQGRAAMLFDGTWVSAELEKVGSPVKCKIVARKFPRVEGGRGSLTEYLGGPSECFMVSANTPHKKEAVRAAKFLCEAVSKQLYIAGKGLPLWKTDGGEGFSVNPLIIEQEDMVKDATDFVPWWDVTLSGKEADIHKSLVRKLFERMISPLQYSLEMHKLSH